MTSEEIVKAGVAVAQKIVHAAAVGMKESQEPDSLSILLAAFYVAIQGIDDDINQIFKPTLIAMLKEGLPTANQTGEHSHE